MAHKVSKKLRAALASQWQCNISHDAHYRDVVQAVLEDVNSPRTLAMSLAMRGTHDSLLDLCDINPDNYNGPKPYILDNLACTLVKKYPHWETSYDPLLTAKKTFISCEVKCQDTNNRIRQRRRQFRDDKVAQIITSASCIISEILGPCPDIQSLDFEFGPGATFLVRGRTTPQEKLGSALDVTPQAKREAVELLQSTPGWLALHGVSPLDSSRITECLTEIQGDRLSFVPKTAKTHRTIAVGPMLNVLLQKGYGSFIRSKLKASGLHLNRAPEKHRRLAQKASISNALATVDLKSASDTISTEVVRELLPVSWFERLDSIRSQKYTVEGKWYEYHKFSAMGNGFTFELESLLFYALAKAACKVDRLDGRRVTVNGDDIIIPVKAYDALRATLDFLGFEINTEKTFVNSQFRESCGGDYYNGTFARGFYVKDRFTLSDIVRLRNYLYRTGFRFWLRNTWNLLRSILKPWLPILAGPEDGTDDHIVFDDIASSSIFNFVKVSVKKRPRTQNWHRRKTLLLYEAMFIARVPEPSYSDRERLSTEQYVVKVCRRYA